MHIEAMPLIAACLFCAGITMMYGGTAMLLDRRSRAVVTGAGVLITAGVIVLGLTLWGVMQ